MLNISFRWKFKDFLDMILKYFFITASYAFSSVPLCRRMLGLNSKVEKARTGYSVAWRKIIHEKT
jgi:hypothetical protein